MKGTQSIKIEQFQIIAFALEQQLITGKQVTVCNL
jgi:hypothetical protein